MNRPPFKILESRVPSWANRHVRDAARVPVSLINNIYWWSGAARKCTFRPRRPSKYAGSGAGSAGFRISLNQQKRELRPRGVPKSGRAPSGFQRVPAAIGHLVLHLDFHSAQGVLQSTRVPCGFRRVPTRLCSHTFEMVVAFARATPPSEPKSNINLQPAPA